MSASLDHKTPTVPMLTPLIAPFSVLLGANTSPAIVVGLC